MVYELLDPNDVEVELVVRKKSAGRKRSTVESPLDVVENAWGGHGNLNNRAPNTDARNPNAAPEKSGGELGGAIDTAANTDARKKAGDFAAAAAAAAVSIFYFLP